MSRFIKSYIPVVLIFLFLLSCGEKKEKLPPGIWKKEQMVEFLVQAQLVEAKLSDKNINQKIRDSLSEIYYNELFAFYNTDKKSWENNFEYYKQNPDNLNEIYTDVLSELTSMEAVLQGEKGNK